MITSQQMRDIIVSRKLQVIPLRNGTWICKTVDGGRAAPSNLSYSTPEAAVEAADLHFFAAEEREKSRKAETILFALERGDYYIKPKPVTTQNESGESIISTVFDVFSLDGKPTNITDKQSLSDAVVEIEKSKKDNGKAKV